MVPLIALTCCQPITQTIKSRKKRLPTRLAHPAYWARHTETLNCQPSDCLSHDSSLPTIGRDGCQVKSPSFQCIRLSTSTNTPLIWKVSTTSLEEYMGCGQRMMLCSIMNVEGVNWSHLLQWNREHINQPQGWQLSEDQILLPSIQLPNSSSRHFISSTPSTFWSQFHLGTTSCHKSHCCKSCPLST